MSNPSGHNPGQPPGGYPPQGYGPPPGYGPPQQPHGGPPQQPGHPTPAPMRAAEPPRRKGGSRALPIVVSAGLAVGVFAGLMVIRGTGDEGDGGKDTTATLPLADAGPAPADAAPPPDAGVDASPPDAGPPTATLSFTIEPPPAELEGFSLEVDGQPVEGTSYTVTLPMGAKDKKVQIVAKASGYYSKRLKETVAADDEKTIELKLYKRKSGGSSNSGNSGNSNSGPGGIIDL